MYGNGSGTALFSAWKARAYIDVFTGTFIWCFAGELRFRAGQVSKAIELPAQVRATNLFQTVRFRRGMKEAYSAIFHFVSTQRFLTRTRTRGSGVMA